MTGGSRSSYAALLGLQLLAGCRAQQSSAERQPEPSYRERPDKMVELRGKIFVTGSEPATSVTLVPGQGASVRLRGELEPELARLSGAEVSVEGIEKTSGLPGLEVHRYNILRIDGEVPSVGTLTMREGVLSLAGRDTVELSNPPAELRGKVGAKVWIVGSLVGNKLGVQSYGIIREP